MQIKIFLERTGAKLRGIPFSQSTVERPTRECAQRRKTTEEEEKVSSKIFSDTLLPAQSATASMPIPTAPQNFASSRAYTSKAGSNTPEILSRDTRWNAPKILAGDFPFRAGSDTIPDQWRADSTLSVP